MRRMSNLVLGFNVIEVDAFLAPDPAGTQQ